MKNQFIPYSLALKLKELGFDEECFGVYVNGNFEHHYRSKNSKFNPNSKLDKRDLECCTAPLWQQAFEWFANNHNLEGNIKSWREGENKYYYYSVNELYSPSTYRLKFDTKEQARQACLEKLIELCEKK